jgi:hypothetical protein
MVIIELPALNTRRRTWSILPEPSKKQSRMIGLPEMKSRKRCWANTIACSCSGATKTCTQPGWQTAFSTSFDASVVLLATCRPVNSPTFGALVLYMALRYG